MAAPHRHKTIAAAACLAAAWLVFLSPSAIAQDDRVEAFTLAGLDGDKLSDADLKRGATALVIWASWSPRCRDIAPRVNALRALLSTEARLATVVFQEDPGDVRSFLASSPLNVPVYLDRDGTFSKRHAVTTLPSLLVFRDGQSVYRGPLPAEPAPVIRRALR